MAKPSIKEQLFEDFVRAARNTLQALESQYNVNGVIEQVFGPSNLSEEEALEHFRVSRPWATLSQLFDYAIEGETGGLDPMDIVIDGSDVVKLATSENYSPSAEWERIIAMGDGRYGLDDGEAVELSKVALLARVDTRTVRNAISAGELVSFKRDDGVYIENASARQWLLGRRGFKPTVADQEDSSLQLSDVKSPHLFGSLLAQRRAKLNLSSEDSKVVPLHPRITQEAQSQLESGVFNMPLDAVFPLADLYQLDRKELLECVMRVFFAEELRLLSGQ